MTEGKSHQALAVAVNILFVNIHFSAMLENTFDHAGNFRRGAPFEL
jgi:hypothetical protein